jgi:hypothetical protein
MAGFIIPDPQTGEENRGFALVPRTRQDCGGFSLAPPTRLEF